VGWLADLIAERATPSTDPPLRAALLIYFAALVAVTALAAQCLSHPPAGVVFKAIVAFAGWLNGGPRPAVVTWPSWGYAWVVAVIPSYTWIVVIQSCLGAMALTLFIARLWTELPTLRRTIGGLGLLAVPWHFLQTTLYPTALAGSFALLALLSLDRALTRQRLAWAILAGTLMGLAQNFRTEFVLLPAFLGVLLVGLRRLAVLKVSSLKPLAWFAVTALTLQLPWAAFYHAQTGRFSLTESNFGHVLYVSLGSDAKNPWGVIGDDRGAHEAIRREGYPFSSLSEEGNQILLRLVRQKVQAHPYAVVPRTVQQLKNTIVAPFNWGEPVLAGNGARDLDVLREELKGRLGVGVNVRQLEAYRRTGSLSEAQRNRGAVFALLYQIGTAALGSVLFLLAMAGMIVMLLQARSGPVSTWLCVLAATATYKVLQDVLLLYQVTYLSNVFPIFLPFVAISVATIARVPWIATAPSPSAGPVRR
jgi:hypothetical protein